MYYVYVLRSKKDGQFYVGYTADLRRRFELHDKGKVESTKYRRPLELVYYEASLTKEDALHRERYLKSTYFAARLAPLLESLADQERHLTRLAVRDRDRIRVLDVDEVDWIDIEDEQVTVHVGDQGYPIRRRLTELETRLDPTRFFRAHRSAIVNLDRVKEIIPWFKGSHKLRLATGAEVDLSRRRARALREILGW